MEDFAANQKKVKEKSVYLLHLDAPRIFLLVSVFLGVVVATFLFGMNFSGHRDGKDTALSHNDSIFDPQKELDLLNRDIPTPPDNDGKKSDDKRRDHENKTADLSEKKELKPAGEIWKGDNLNSAAAPEKENILDQGDKNAGQKKKAVKEKKDSQEAAIAKSPDRADKKKPVKDKKANGKKKKSVVEVSSDDADTSKISSPRFSIQVASFDKKAHAETEIQSLKEMSYDAYLDKTNIGNKKYFRVRIGPLFSKDKAIDLLNKVQKNERYNQSYLVKE